VAGLLLWVIAVAGEATADRQLERFKADRGTRVACVVGLWNASRHPNYFFEWLVWCAYAVFALGSPWGWVLCIARRDALLLLRVTGIPALEEAPSAPRARLSRYQQTTSAFVPGSSGGRRAMWLDRLLEADVLPDVALRAGIRRQLKVRLREEDRGGLEADHAQLMRHVDALVRSPIALETHAANAQHYEVSTAVLRARARPPPEVQLLLLERDDDTLATAEEPCWRSPAVGRHPVTHACARLGALGSLSLWVAQRHPAAASWRSNSRPQKAFIERRPGRWSHDVDVTTADMNVFEPGETFDRIVSE